LRHQETAQGTPDDLFDWGHFARAASQVRKPTPGTITIAFGGEGEGGHTQHAWDWKVADTFPFFPDGAGKEANKRRAYDVSTGEEPRWLHSGTITSPNGDAKSERA